MSIPIVQNSNFTSWMSSIIHEEKLKILTKISEEHDIPMENLEKYNQVSDSQVQEYIDIFSSKKTSKKTTKNETSTTTKPRKTKKQEKTIEVTEDTISKIEGCELCVCEAHFTNRHIDW